MSKFGHLYIDLSKTYLDMDIIELLSKLSEPVSVTEKKLCMPSGTLAKAKKGIRKLPEKWEDKLSEYVFSINPLLSKDVSNLKPTTSPPKSEPEKQIPKVEKWITDISDFCQSEGIVPWDLIDYYKNKKVKKEVQHDVPHKISLSELSTNKETELSKFQLELRKKKLGY